MYSAAYYNFRTPLYYNFPTEVYYIFSPKLHFSNRQNTCILYLSYDLANHKTDMKYNNGEITLAMFAKIPTTTFAKFSTGRTYLATYLS